MGTLLLTFVFIGIVTMFLTDLLKTGIFVAVASLAAYFYFSTIGSWTVIALLVIGLLLMVLEIFVPNFGLLGLLGFVSTILGLYLTTGNLGKTIIDLFIALALSSIFIIILFKKGITSSNWDRYILNAQIVSNEKSDKLEKDTQLSAGMTGEAITPLRPSGKALFENMQTSFDVLSDGGHISQGTKIVIQEIIGNKIIVRKN